MRTLKTSLALVLCLLTGCGTMCYNGSSFDEDEQARMADAGVESECVTVTQGD